MAKQKQDDYWVLLGASAGGLEALKCFLENFTVRQQCYLIVAQHLDPKHPTILKELLARTTDMPVQLVETDIQPEVGQVYIISPGHNATLKEGKICLSPAAMVGPKPSIDVLLNSLASSVGEKAIAVILSGTGTDGAQGAMAIKAQNGVVFAQSLESAKYNGMPNAAIETGVVDMVLPPDAIAKKIQDYVTTSELSFKVVKQPTTQNKLERIFKKIFEETGYDFSGYKLKTIQRRIARRMAVHRLTSLEQYLDFIESSPHEIDSLFKDFLISVTAFFRDKEAFEDLKKVIDNIVERTPESESIRVWVPGCANGEEAYSIGILLHQALVKRRKTTAYQIFASDIDESALNQARRGIFSAAQIDEIESEILESFFQPRDGQYMISKSIRDRIVFAKQNVINDPPFSKVDLISCRNLLIYFSQDLQKRVLQTFHFALKNSSYLFLGKSESADTTSQELFSPYFKKSHIFLRKNMDLSNAVDQIQSANSYAKMAKQNNPNQVQFEKQTIANRLDQVLLQEIVPASLVIDRSGQVLHIRGEMSRYLKFPQGKIDTNILSLAQDDIKVDIRALLSRAKDVGQATSQSLFFSSENQQILFINIRRFDLLDEDSEHFIVSFLPAKVDESFFVNPEVVDVKKREANDLLVNEIALFKERLQTSMEELETTNEELQSTNEELQSANEELQSTNEELQTSNEELQSTNEELSTVNQELEVKTYEMEQLNNDLENMLESMNELIIVLDSRLRVIRYTQIAGKTFGLTSDSLNQTITTLGLPVDIPNLRHELLSVIDYAKEASISGRFKAVKYSVRMIPYLNHGDTVSGILMFFEDARHLSRIRPEVNSVKSFELLGNDFDYGLLVIDEIGSIVYTNQLGASMLGYDKEAVNFDKLNQFLPEPYASQGSSFVTDYLPEHLLNNDWQGLAFKTKNSERQLIKIRVDETWLNAEKHYLIRMKMSNA